MREKEEYAIVCLFNRHDSNSGTARTAFHGRMTLKQHVNLTSQDEESSDR